jgi:MraZ protein
LDQFLSSFVNKIDRKGRVSVPADFRAVLARRGSENLVLYPAIHYPALDGGGEDFLRELDKRIDSLPPLSQEREDLVFAIKPLVRLLKFDSEGRIMLTEDLIAHAGLSENAVFAGLGGGFQIWHPDQYREHQRRTLEAVRATRQSRAAR